MSFPDLAFLDLQWLVVNSDVDSFGPDFSVTEAVGINDELVVVDVVLKCCDIPVTDANKLEFLERRFKYSIRSSRASQVNYTRSSRVYMRSCRPRCCCPWTHEGLLRFTTDLTRVPLGGFVALTNYSGIAVVGK